jgi:HK97 gp10 family phage protein
MTSNFSAGRSRLRRKMTRNIPAKAKAAAKAAVVQGAREIAAFQRTLVPVEDGDLLRSIDVVEPGQVGPKGYPTREGQALVTAGGDATTKTVGGGKYDYDYALAQEFGTENIPAQPFFFPAWRALRQRARGRITRAINNAVKDGAK